MTNALEEVIERAQELPEIEQDLVGEIVLMPCGRSLDVDSGTRRQRNKIMHQPSSINLTLLGLNGWPRSLR
jgi:hypothetical protein